MKAKKNTKDSTDIAELKRGVKALQATGNPIAFAPIVKFLAPILGRIAARYAARWAAAKLKKRISPKISDQIVSSVSEKMVDIASKIITKK